MPKIHIGFERKSTRFFSDFDQICVWNLSDFCSQSEPNLIFCENFSNMFEIWFQMDCAKSCRFRTDFVQISVRNISDFCSKSDSNMSNVSSASSPHKILNYLRALPKMHIGFERKSTRFLSDFDQVSSKSNRFLFQTCSKSDSKRTRKIL